MQKARTKILQLLMNQIYAAFSAQHYKIITPYILLEHVIRTIHLIRSVHVYSKLHFHHKSSVVPCSDNNCCASMFMIMLNVPGLLRL